MYARKGEFYCMLYLNKSDFKNEKENWGYPSDHVALGKPLKTHFLPL